MLDNHIKRILRKNWIVTRDPKIKSLYSTQTLYVEDMLKKFKPHEWDKFTSSLKFENKSIYQLSHRLIKKTPFCHPLKLPDGDKIYDDKAKSELFASTMERQFMNNPVQDLLEVEYSINTILSGKSMSLDLVTPNYVWKVIKKLPPGKAPGDDGVNNMAFKNLPGIAIILLANIYIASLRLSYFPKIWKKATIVMIPKPRKDYMVPENHKLISLLTTMSKIFEKLILQ